MLFAKTLCFFVLIQRSSFYVMCYVSGPGQNQAWPMLFRREISLSMKSIPSNAVRGPANTKGLPQICPRARVPF